jgi:hypothetical protein
MENTPDIENIVRTEQAKILPPFTMHQVEGTNLSYSDPMSLNSQTLSLENPQIQLLELTPKNENDFAISALFLTAQIDGEQKPIGHVTFNSLGTQKDIISLSVNYARTRHIQSHQDKLPEQLQKSINGGHFFEALETKDTEITRGKGLGKLLFLAGLAHMNDIGYNDVKISGDLTVGQQGPLNSSFYDKYGAKFSQQHGEQVIETNITNKHKDYLNSVFIK